MTRTRALAPLLAVTALAVGCKHGSDSPTEKDLLLCRDGVDNDGDQLVDCDDDDCRIFCNFRDGGGSKFGDGGETGTDGHVPDGGNSDGGDPADAEGDGDDDAGVEYVQCSRDDDCSDSLLSCYEFYEDGRPVAGNVCAPRGRYCLSDEECPAGVTCAPIAAWAGFGKFCHVTSPNCTSHQDCPQGFHCEGPGQHKTCVDRRVSCFNNHSCPSWYRCLISPSLEKICQPRGAESCTTATDCTGSQICVDIEGDGTTECQYPNGECTTNADCDQEVCGGGVDSRTGASCGVIGRCLNNSQCPPQYNCRDVNGDGVQECQRNNGTCHLDSDCPVGQLCVPQGPEGIPECAGG